MFERPRTAIPLALILFLTVSVINGIFLHKVIGLALDRLLLAWLLLLLILESIVGVLLVLTVKTIVDISRYRWQRVADVARV